MAAPLSSEGAASQQPRETPIGTLSAGASAKVPLMPETIKLPASVVGRLLTEATGYKEFTFTDEELEYLTALWASVPGIEVAPLHQALVGTASVFGIKAGGFFAYKKSKGGSHDDTGE